MTMPRLPAWVGAAEVCGRALERVGAFKALLSPLDIIDEARRKTGLSDLGEGDVETPLSLLCAVEDDGLGPTFAGRYAQRKALVDCLVNRLLVTEELRAHPEALDRPVRRPLIVAGRGRTGTTLLQRLLSQDPACRPLLAWEALHPAPAPDPATHGADPRIQRTRKDVGLLLSVFPGLLAMHYTDATTPEECEWLMHNALTNPGFLWKYPEYKAFNRWCAEQDPAIAYGWHTRQLQILQRRFPEGHWVLKGNEHVDHLATVLKTYPDACILQTHRDPTRCVASDLSLNLSVLSLKNRPTEAFLRRSAAEMMEGYAAALESTIEARQGPGGDRVFDVHYDRLVADPLGTVRAIYDRFDLPFTAAFEGRLKAWIAENPQGKHGIHRYSLEAFGLSEADVNRRFAAYCRAFGVRPEDSTPRRAS